MGCNGKKPADGKPGWESSWIGVELVKAVTLFVSMWGNVEV